MQVTRVQSLVREDSLEKGMTTRFSLLAWEMPWTEEPGGLQSMGLQESDETKPLPSPPKFKKGLRKQGSVG